MRRLTNYLDNPQDQIACEFCGREYSRKYEDLEDFNAPGVN